ncbi:MAG TPA: hypothetical protein VFW34_08735 [Candidatus Rubrimentiphilum sp.]|nr:hypothetical protein [Candidatus Rubrimentiphilum sp.]
MPASISPGSIVPPPMAVTAILPASAMQSPVSAGVKPMSAVQGANYTQLSGAASFAVGSPDGSLWVLSNQPSGPDKYIWHFQNGAWTNISGLANHISIAPDLSLYASNSAGGAYHNVGGTWTALGGGVSDIAAASDNSLFVLSNSQPAGNDQGIWHYTSGWSQVPGAGVRIAASLDVGTHVVPGGIVGPGGIYVVNSSGSIYYTPGNGSWVAFPGAAAAISPSVGGLFVLGYPASSGGTPIYYYDLDNPGWTQFGGSGVSIAAGATQLYVISASTAIWTTPLLPAAVPVSYFRQLSALKVTNTLGTNMSSILGVAISEAADQTSNGQNGTMNLGSLTIGSGTTAQSIGIQPQSISAQQHAAVEGGGVHRGANDGPDTEFQTRQLRRLLPRPASSKPAIRPLTSTIGTNPIVGATANIWVSKSAIGSSSATYLQVPSTLEFQSAHGNVWIDNTLLGSDPSFSGASLSTTVAQIGADLENAVTSDTAHFASFDYANNAPGVGLQYEAYDSSGNDLHRSDNQYINEPTDKRINLEILNTASLGSGVGGYFSSINYTPQEIWNYFISHPTTGSPTPMSNEAPFIYCGWFASNGANYELQEDLVRGTAHELQHLINFVNHSILPAAASTYSFSGAEDPFINEGLSMLSQDLAVNTLHPTQAFDVADAMSHAQQYLSSPQNYSLSGFIGIDPSSWGGNGSTPKYNCGGGCYGSAYLFERYMRDRFGGDTYTKGMETSQQTGFANLQANGGNEPASALMGDFAIAVATNSQQISPPNAQFNLGTFNTRATYTDQLGGSRTLTGVAAAITLSINGSTSFTPPIGGFGFFGLAPNNGSAVSIVDGTGTFSLFGGLAQH